ncbi:hypothetical protein BX600DRAFT_475463 [Xylariales sp. PMI_506]|nr:hypothetical protein BX600DRAFT_475463 [Xylariales sp. PMI_506]
MSTIEFDTSSFDESYNDTVNTVNSGAKAVSVGVIVVIVIVVLAFLGTCVTVICLLVRSRRRRAARLDALNNQMSMVAPSTMYTGVTSAVPRNSDPQESAPLWPGNNNELAGSAVPSRYEAPYNPMEPREVEGHQQKGDEVKSEWGPQAHQQPWTDQSSGAGYGGAAPRSELPV